MFKTRKGDNLSPAKIKNFKNQNAITLIALVLTIIVLLILAGVALSLVVGEDGITGRAVNAGKTHNISGAKDKFELDVANYASEFYREKYVSSNQSATSIKDYILGKIVTGIDYTVDEKNLATGEVRISVADGTNATGTVGEDGKVIWSGMSTEPVVSWTKDGNNITNGTVTLKIGDYVNYDPTDGATTTTYTSLKEKSGWDNDQVFNVGTYKTNGYGWRVFGVENGKILLIADEMIVPDSGGYLDSTYNTTYYYLKGQAGYQDGVSELNKIGDLYGHGKYADGGRSINADDVNRMTGFDPTGYPDYGSKYTVNGTEYTNTYYDYSIPEELRSDSLKESLLLGDHLTSSGSYRNYWLGSPFVDCNTGIAFWGLRYVGTGGYVDYFSLAGSDDGFGSYYSFGVLPVVSLKSGIQLEPGSQEGEWSFVD